MNISGLIEESLADGLGIRFVIFISGCLHCCKGCQNTQTWDFNYGQEFTKELQLQIVNKIKSNPLIDGITISGGDSFYSSKEMIEFIKLLKDKIPNIDIWTYTGFTYEEIINSHDNNMINYLKFIDVLVDGLYKKQLRDLKLKFRGSKNQRIINVQESLKQNKVILLME